MQHEFITVFPNTFHTNLCFILVCMAEPSLWLAYTIYSCTIVCSLYSVSLMAFSSFVLSLDLYKFVFKVDLGRKGNLVEGIV
jgi:hypothetical protein